MPQLNGWYSGLRVDSLHRMRNTAAGNPRWSVVLTAVTKGGLTPDVIGAETAPDAQCAYAIDNREYRDEPHDYQFRDGYITKIRKPEGAR